MNYNIVQAIFIFVLCFLISIAIDKLLKKLESQFDSGASEPLRLFSNSQRAILLFIGGMMALSKLGFDVTALIAGLGLTGFALGFALKDAVSNLIAGVMIVLYKPVELGDIIDITGSQGKVVDLNLRYITIKSEGITHLIPNSLLLSNKVSILEENTINE